MRRWSVVVSLLVLVLVLGAPPASAGHHGGVRNGLIAFMRVDADGFWQVWVARSDLSHARQLTDLDADSGVPIWSPDGKRLAFDSTRADPDRNADPFINDVYTMKPDGTDIIKLTNSVGNAGGSPGWSPDGRLIAFEADRGDYPAKAGIYVMNARDGSHVRRVTSLPEGVGWDGGPRFSPDGKRIVFTRFREDGTAVHIINVDGSGLRRLTTWEMNANDPTWSPDGKRMVFAAYPPEYPYGSVWTLRPDGHDLTNLTPDPTTPGAHDVYADPVFSPDGTRIMLLHGLSYDDGRFNIGLATMRPNGTGLEYVGDGTGEEHQPTWGRRPNGR